MFPTTLSQNILNVKFLKHGLPYFVNRKLICVAGQTDFKLQTK